MPQREWGLADPDGRIIIPCRYDEVGDCMGAGYVVPVRLGSTWSFITHKGKDASAVAYDVVEPYYWRMYLVQRGGLWGFVNDFGQEVVSCQFEGIQLVDEESRLVFGRAETPVCLQGKWGIINDKGQLVLPCAYDQIGTIHNGMAEVRMGKQWQSVTFE